ncbi:MAG: methyltransferase [Polyangiaceae bacterium]|jgi:hypothetical protein
MDEQDPSSLLLLGTRFWEAKALLAAVELGVFAILSESPLSCEELAQQAGLNGRGAADFLDVLVSLKLLARAEGRYANTPRAERFLVPDSPSYIGGALELANSRLYPVWAKLTDALRTGQPQNEAKEAPDYYDNLTGHPDRLKSFMRAMTGLSLHASNALAANFPWNEFASFVDVGGAQGVLAVQVAAAHEHLVGASFDLPPVGPIFNAYVSSFGLQHRLRFQAGNFLLEPLPNADVIIMGHVLHNWNLEQKLMLIRKAYDAVPPSGALIVYEALIDDERQKNAFGLLMSLNMLLVTTGGFVFTGADCCSWMRAAGFRETRVEHLDGPDWAVIATK